MASRFWPLIDFISLLNTPSSAIRRNAELRSQRTPGLKREEVALRAGISSEWYLKLEQGRAGSPSSATVDALADALNLNETEAEHLRSIASAGHREPFEREEVPETLRQIVA